MHRDIDLTKAKIGMTRAEVVEVLGEPDDMSIGTRKYPTPMIYKYGKVELHFEPWKAGKLVRFSRPEPPSGC